MMERGRSQARRRWSRRKTAGRRGFAPGRESWRLPWGDQLAEFALQAGLVAPLLAPDALELDGDGRSGDEEPAGSAGGGRR